jgi:rod shape determining protein RodA
VAIERGATSAARPNAGLRRLRLMGILRLQPPKLTALNARSATAILNVFDVQLAFYALALAVVGLMMAYSNSPDGARLAVGSTFARGLVWLALAIVCFTAATAFDYRWLRTFSWPVYIVNLAILTITLLFGSGIGGVSRWVTIFGLQFQFSEIAKVLTIIVLANFIASRDERIGKLSTIFGAALVVMPPLALVLSQPDLGTSLVFGAVLIGVLFVSGASLRWLTLVGAAAVASMPIIWNYVLQGFQKQRLLSFLDPTNDPLNGGFQVAQSQIAVGSGGLFGKGLTNGTQSTLDYLPVQTTDFAGAVLLEELGFIGGIVVLLLFTALIWRILLAGWRSSDPFGLAFAAGVASMILFQLLVNLGMVIGLMPVTGIPLPFITHGGASIISIAIGLGILQSINLRQARPQW